MLTLQLFLYADRVTESMKKAIDETNRRRTIQLAYNKENNITPQTIRKEIRKELTKQFQARKTAQQAINLTENEYDKAQLSVELEREMLKAAESLDFERAAYLRDQLVEIKDMPEIGVKNGQ